MKGSITSSVDIYIYSYTLVAKLLRLLPLVSLNGCPPRLLKVYWPRSITPENRSLWRVADQRNYIDLSRSMNRSEDKYFRGGAVPFANRPPTHAPNIRDEIKLIKFWNWKIKIKYINKIRRGFGWHLTISLREKKVRGKKERFNSRVGGKFSTKHVIV